MREALFQESEEAESRCLPLGDLCGYYQDLFEHAPDAYLVTDGEGVIREANRAASSLLGSASEALAGRPLPGFVTDAARETFCADLARLRRTRHPDATPAGKPPPAVYSNTVPFRSARGTPFDADVIVTAGRDAEGRLVLLRWMLHDVTARRQAEQVEEELRQSEARFCALFASAAIGITLTDLQGRPVQSNPARQQIFGYTAEELLTLRFEEYTHPEDCFLDQKCFAELAVGRRDCYRMEKRCYRKDGSLVRTHFTATLIRDALGRPQLIMALEEDVSELKRLEEELRQSQKMEAIGRLAGGVAHDFNNMLAAIIGYNDLVLERIGSDATLRRPLQEVLRAGQRAAALTRQLLTFSRKQVPAPQVLDLGEVVLNVQRMLRRLIGEDIELVTVTDPMAGRVRADAGQIEQVLLNLAINARDAMPDGGKLAVEVTNAFLDEEGAGAAPGVRPGAYVMLRVSDTGRGMDAATLSRIFEPFFTTKEQDKGTGLGLSTVYGIVQQNGGHIEVESEPGRGATFRVYLPQTEDGPRSEQAAEGGVTRCLGSETILLAEDEPIVRGLVCEVLRLSGYTVLEAIQGDDALRLCGQHERGIDLLLTDVVMPGMSGRELAERARALQPEMKVLYISGYQDDARVQPDALGSERAFLAKPFTPAVLAQKVRDVLGES